MTSNQSFFSETRSGANQTKAAPPTAEDALSIITCGYVTKAEVQASIEAMAQGLVGEINDAQTNDEFISQVQDYLRKVRESRGIKTAEVIGIGTYVGYEITKGKHGAPHKMCVFYSDKVLNTATLSKGVSWRRFKAKVPEFIRSKINSVTVSFATNCPAPITEIVFDSYSMLTQP